MGEDAKPEEAAPAAEGETKGFSIKMPKILGGGDKEPVNELCPSLTFKERIYGFAICMACGVFIGILSWMAIFHRKWTRYGVLMTISNIVAIGASMFLAGPHRQMKSMMEETRFIATCVYGVAMVCTLIAAFAVKSPALVIICSFIQYCAMIWYGLSYIPFARNIVKGCLKGAVSG